MDDDTRGAASEAIGEMKLRLQQALDYLDRYPDNVLALESVAVLCHQVVALIECPEEM